MGDISGMSCRTLGGTYDTFLSIYRMSPGEMREIDVTRLKPGTVRMQTRISYFSVEPKDYTNGPVMTSNQGTNGEDCTPVQLHFELK